MRLVAGVMRLTRKRQMSTPARAQRRIHAPKGSAEPTAAIRSRHTVTQYRESGFDVHRVVPKDGRWTRSVLYLHGGAYIAEIAPQHYGFISRLVDAGIRVDVPIYGLAPHHTAVQAYDLIASVYRRLLADTDPVQITVMGDSAGAGLALGFVQQSPDLGLPLPGHVVLVSPWLDATLSNPEVVAVERRDPWLSSVGLREAARVWAGDLPLDDPRVSPIRGSTRGLPPVDIWCGTRDLFLPDVLALTRDILDGGGRARLTQCAGAIHVYPVLPTPEGRTATREIVASVVGPSRR
ncbi:alpha/beta hydrolase [Williamsia maris]|uniref:Acetyl esterase/lipase n=2 Tax=Williamsia maris TaxID=72806 RepID=A0ABT1HJ70_9NOCA|nr:Acetyl esterase/lipase [Williamsia maris]